MKKISCVIENTAKRGSPFWAEHGVSFLFQVDDRCVLFDTGGSEEILLHNLDLLDVCPNGIEALVLSHAHNDHTGGLPAFLGRFPGIKVHASPDIFRLRYSLRKGQSKSIGMSMSQAEMTSLADVRLDDRPLEVLPGLWTTGEITQRTEFEGRSTGHSVRDGENWQPDPYRDDMSMVLETRDGLVLICGCCHAGLLNTLAHVRRHFQQPVTTILGGTHLVEANAEQMAHVITELRDTYDSPALYLNHCTGEEAIFTLKNVFGDLVNFCPAGTLLTFE